MSAYAPGSTAIMQEPDTHEHAPFKKGIREIKAEMHFNMEMECKKQGKPINKFPWGPHEYVALVEEALERFVNKFPNCPLLGAIELNFLALRPDPSENGDGFPCLELKLLEDCEAPSTKKLLQQPWCKRYPPAKGIATAWCQRRDKGIRELDPSEPFPKPNWDVLEDQKLFENDLPEKASQEDEPIVFEIDATFDDLELTQSQKLMLLPVDMRIGELCYPKIIHNRVKQHNKAHRTGHRKNKWAAKLGNYSIGKLGRKWARRVKSMGAVDGIKEIRSKQKSTVAPLKGQKPLLQGEKRPRYAQVTVKKTGAMTKKSGATRAHASVAKAKAIEAGEDVEELMVNEWLHKEARVVDEEAGAQHLGHFGTVVRVFMVKPHSGEPHYLRLAIGRATQWTSEFKGFFSVKASWCQDCAHESKVKPMPPIMDFRAWRGKVKKDVQNQLQILEHPENLEFVVPNTMIEHMTIRAALLEKGLRFGLSEVKHLPPSLIN